MSERSAPFCLLRLTLCCRYPQGIKWILDENLEEILLWLCSNGEHAEQVIAGAMLDLQAILQAIDGFVHL